MKKKDKNKRKNREILLIFFLLGGLLVKLHTFLFKKNKLNLGDIKDNLDDFIEKEEKEVKELVTGKESFKEYCEDSSSLFMDYFIPHDGNNHKPKILRAKPLLIIVIFSILLKLGVMGYLFFIYPNMAKMQTEIVSEILTLTNQDRQDNNLPSFEINPVLSSSALAKANDMIANNYFSHYGPDGKKPWDWINRGEYAYLNIGENLAMNFSTANSAHLALMQSPLHKKNILNNNYQEIGLAVVSGEIDGKSTTILVELFGSRKRIEESVEMTEKEDKTVVALAETQETEVRVLASEKTEPKKEEIIKEEVLADEEINISGEKVIEIEEEISENEEDDLKIEEKTEDNEENIIAQIEEKNDLNKEVLVISQENDKKINLGIALVTFSKYSYILMLIGVISFLLINIFVRIRIQHKPVIIQSLLVLIVLFGLLLSNSYILGDLIEKILII